MVINELIYLHSFNHTSGLSFLKFPNQTQKISECETVVISAYDFDFNSDLYKTELIDFVNNGKKLIIDASTEIMGKNTIDFLGKPLIAWTIEQCRSSEYVSDIWVSSNDPLILSIASKYGAKTIERPDSISGDLATSESGWLHAITHLIDRGADMLTVKELLGHSSLSSTQHYTQLNLETIKKVYQKNHPRGE